MVERKFNLDPDWSDDSEEEERKARGMGGAGAIRPLVAVRLTTRRQHRRIARLRLDLAAGGEHAWPPSRLHHGRQAFQRPLQYAYAEPKKEDAPSVERDLPVHSTTCVVRSCRVALFCFVAHSSLKNCKDVYK